MRLGYGAMVTTVRSSPMAGHYSLPLVATSVVIAILAAYASLDLVERVTHSHGHSRGVWLICGAIAMGTGIWSTHYIAMLAFSLPVVVKYDWPTVLVSLLVAMVASVGGLLAASRRILSPVVTVIGSVFMGGGIAAMHYIGMEAMRLPAECSYSASLVGLSVLLAIALAAVALRRSFALRGTGSLSRPKVVNAVILGAAICIMHYVGMAAVSFVPAPLVLARFHHAIGISHLGIASVTAVSALILVSVYVGSTLDRNFNRQALALQGSEQRYRQIVESAFDAFLAIDEEGRITDWSDRAVTMFGWQRDEALGRSVSEIVPRDGECAGEQPGLRARLTGEDGRSQARVELRVRHREGHEFPAEAAISSVKVGSTTIYTAFIHDVSKRKRAEREKEEAKAAAEEGNRVKSQFLANMSHEIRTPLHGVIGMTELALESELSVEQREYLQTIKSSADTLLGVINGILDFSKIEAGKVELDEVEFDLCECMEETLNTLALPADEKGLELMCEISPGVPEVVLGDPGKLRQILSNLVGNAIKFTERGEVSLLAHVERAAAERVLVHFVVADTGIGIAPQMLDTIFHPFAQADASTTREYGGTGLGLTISRRLAELMGGKIWIESEVGRGSRFHFTLEFKRAYSRLNRVDSIDATEVLAGARVLVIDDNQTNRRILQTLLKSWGMTPTVASSAEEGLSALRESPDSFPLIVADMHMPDIDGFDMVERMRQEGGSRAATIMLLTSAARRVDLARCRELGIDAYLFKPVRRMELREAIANRLGAGQQLPALMVPRDSAQEGVSPHSLAILLVEDNQVNQKLGVRLLERRGHQVRVVANGLEVLAALARRSYDLVLMNAQMPGMDGIELATIIRQQEKETGLHQPIVAMTALAMTHERKRCLAAGMDSCITKPIQAAELDQILEGLMAQRSNTEGVAPMVRSFGAATVDANELLDRLGGDFEILRELTELFQIDYPGKVWLIHQAIDQGNAPGVERASHALKGALSNLSAIEATAMAAKLEGLGASGDLHAAKIALNDLERELARTMDFLQTLCRRPRL